MLRNPGPQKRRHFNLSIVTGEEFLFRRKRLKPHRAVNAPDQMRANALTLARCKLAVEIFFQKLRTNFTLHN
jgi:hypothetical protein